MRYDNMLTWFVHIVAQKQPSLIVGIKNVTIKFGDADNA